uniref:Sushi domain-containing protein n=1 Tax=Anas platyrhynchos TaxID=8839 RepID=A0A8B9T4P0_ANAPL
FFIFFLTTSILTDLPSLAVVRCENPVVENGKKLTGFVEQYTYGDTVAFECLPGYFMNGSHTAKCDADNNWNPPLPKCERLIRCPPPYIKNGKSKSAARYIYRAGASVSFTCNPGYTLQGSPTSTCQADSRWSPPLPECKKGKCPSGCVVDGEGLIYGPGQTVTIQCQDGYSLQGTATILCQEDGSWEPPAPLCDLLFWEQEPDPLESFGEIQLFLFNNGCVNQNKQFFKANQTSFLRTVLFVCLHLARRPCLTLVSLFFPNRWLWCSYKVALC